MEMFENPIAGIVVVAVIACLMLLIVELARMRQTASAEEKSTHDIALEVLAGLWGNGQERIDRLTAAGYDPESVQAEVNEILKKERNIL